MADAINNTFILILQNFTRAIIKKMPILMVNNSTFSKVLPTGFESIK